MGEALCAQVCIHVMKATAGAFGVGYLAYKMLDRVVDHSETPALQRLGLGPGILHSLTAKFLGIEFGHSPNKIAAGTDSPNANRQWRLLAHGSPPQRDNVCLPAAH